MISYEHAQTNNVFHEGRGISTIHQRVFLGSVFASVVLKSPKEPHNNRHLSMVEALRPAPVALQVQAGYKDGLQRDTAQKCLVYSATTRLLAAEHTMPVIVHLASLG
jgi:hypothetical protein